MLLRATVILALLLCQCGRPAEERGVRVAAAANLSVMFGELARACERTSGVRMTPSFGATAQLEQQIENGGPFDLFLAADTQHIDALGAKGLVSEGSRAIYARGKLVIWAPRRPDIRTIRDLARPDVKAIAVAKPELAPYGEASLEALKGAQLWPALEKKVVYAQNVQAVKQFADSSNVDAAFTALALVKSLGGHYVAVDESLHKPLDQAMCIVKTTQHAEQARRVEDFLLGPDGQAIFRRSGYLPIGGQ